MITLALAKQYLNIHISNSTEDVILQLLIDAAVAQSQLIVKDTENSAIDLALLKEVSTTYAHRENYLDAENGGLVLSNDTLKILNKFRKIIIL